MVSMHGRQRSAALLLSLALALSGSSCISTHTIEPGPDSPTATEACFNLRNVYSFTPLHGRYVYVRVLNDQHYLLTLDTIYPHLKIAPGVRIEGTWGTICSDSGAMLTYSDYGRPTYCRIIKVEAVESKDAAKQLMEERTAPRPKG
jgi:hypothetical protein